MSEIEKMQRYIEKTGEGCCAISYDLNTSEWVALIHAPHVSESIVLAFNYGRAKGYRAAKAERRSKV